MKGWREVNLLCPGPSLRRANPNPDFLTVGVNLAIEHSPLDWWAVGDDKPIRTTEILPRVGVLTKPTCIDSIRSGRVVPKCGWDENLHLFNLDFYKPRGKPWYTIWFALLLCRTLGASALHIYGMDMQGESYFKEAPYEGKFTPARWDKERDVAFEILAEFQEKDKITINKY